MLQHRGEIVSLDGQLSRIDLSWLRKHRLMHLEARLVVVVLLGVELIVELGAVGMLLSLTVSAHGLELMVFLAVQLVLLALGTQRWNGTGVVTAVSLQGRLMTAGKYTGSPSKRRDLSKYTVVKEQRLR